ncbi:MAG TPA: 16S rRNA (cytosine(1402)-N(4))-methyltransferase RsmH [Gemmatimonadales bacterium]|nr:16S rRNA (cytosine(1402)-N(4))-methyltransferase RsmH [Gemmatimonadales bacterium]
MTAEHVPVLMNEVLELLDPQPGGKFIDCTLGGAGHSAAILERTSPDGELLGLDADSDSVAAAGLRLAPYGDRVRLAHTNFRFLDRVAAEARFGPVDGILMDLGLSSPQLATEGRGFAFSRDDPLDMRFDPSAGFTAADYLATASPEEIETTLRAYGEEPRARRIAADIVVSRSRQPVETTRQLAAIVSRAAAGRHGGIHPATRSFQALRILVNDELGALQEALPKAASLLRRGGRLAVISFHSLEDRIVKTFLRGLAGHVSEQPLRHLPIPQSTRAPDFRILTPRPVRPSPEEIRRNPRSRSARLRVAERL